MQIDFMYNFCITIQKHKTIAGYENTLEVKSVLGKRNIERFDILNNYF